MDFLDPRDFKTETVSETIDPHLNLSEENEPEPTEKKAPGMTSNEPVKR